MEIQKSTPRIPTGGSAEAEGFEKRRKKHKGEIQKDKEGYGKKPLTDPSETNRKPEGIM